MNAITPIARTGTLYAGAAKLERCLSRYTALRCSIEGTLPIPAAEALMDDIEDYLDVIGVKLKRALTVFEGEIGRAEDAS